MSNVAAIRPKSAINAIIPTGIDEAWRIAKYIEASGLGPSGMKTAEQCMIAIMKGLEMGLPPMTAVERIAVVNGRATVFGDAIPALLWANHFKLDEKEIDNGYSCTVIRPCNSKITRTFTIDDAKQAGLWGKAGPWKQYPKRMLQMRARGLAARDGAADVLAGMYLAEEAQDIPPAKPVDITPPAVSEPTEPTWLDHEALQHHDNRPSVYKYKKETDGEMFLEISGQAQDCESVEKLKQIPDLYSDELLEMPTNYVKLIRDDLMFREKSLTEAETAS